MGDISRSASLGDGEMARWIGVGHDRAGFGGIADLIGTINICLDPGPALQNGSVHCKRPSGLDSSSSSNHPVGQQRRHDPSTGQPGALLQGWHAINVARDEPLPCVEIRKRPLCAQIIGILRKPGIDCGAKEL